MRELLCLFFALTWAPFTSYLHANEENLVARWTFDEGIGSPPLDTSKTQQPTQIVGTPVSIPGRNGGALLFNGYNAYLNCGTNNVYNFTNQITISAWFKVHQFDHRYQALISKGDNAWRLHRKAHSNTFEFACNAFGKSDLWSISGKTNVNDNAWHHVAAVYDGRSAYLYIDGQLDASEDNVPPIQTNNFPVFIGENSQARNRFWNGLIDDVFIYSKALPEKDILILYNHEGITKTNEQEIIADPNHVWDAMKKQLQRYEDWQTNRSLKQQHNQIIGFALLNIAKARQVLNHPQPVIENLYQEITSLIPDSHAAIEAMFELLNNSPEKGVFITETILSTSKDHTLAARFYGKLVDNAINTNNHSDALAYIRRLISEYDTDMVRPELAIAFFQSCSTSTMAQLIPIIKKCITEYPNSNASVAFVQYLDLSTSSSIEKLLYSDYLRSIRKHHSDTKIGEEALVIQTDKLANEGHFLYSLETYQPGILSPTRPEPTIIEDLNHLLEPNTLSSQQDRAFKADTYLSVAHYAYHMELYTLAHHCYETYASLQSYNMELFTKHLITPPRHPRSIQKSDLWFWQGFIKAEQKDLTSAALYYSSYLQHNPTSAYAARAYYDTARAHFAADLHLEAEQLIQQAKAISPCPPVLDFEQKLQLHNKRQQ